MTRCGWLWRRGRRYWPDQYRNWFYSVSLNRIIPTRDDVDSEASPVWWWYGEEDGRNLYTFIEVTLRCASLSSSCKGVGQVGLFAEWLFQRRVLVINIHNLSFPTPSSAKGPARGSSCLLVCATTNISTICFMDRSAHERIYSRGGGGSQVVVHGVIKCGSLFAEMRAHFLLTSLDE